MGARSFSDQTSLTWIHARRHFREGGGGSTETRRISTAANEGSGNTDSWLHNVSKAGTSGGETVATSFVGTIQS